MSSIEEVEGNTLDGLLNMEGKLEKSKMSLI